MNRNFASDACTLTASLYQNGNRTGDFINRMDDFGRFHTGDFSSISYVRPNTVACIRVILTSTRTGNSLKINRMKISKINRMTKKIIGTGDFFSRIKINRIKNQPYQNRPYGKLTVWPYRITGMETQIGSMKIKSTVWKIIITRMKIKSPV